MQVRSLGREDTLEEGMATHSSILAWEIAWTEEPGEQSDMTLNEQQQNYRCLLPCHSESKQSQ